MVAVVRRMPGKDPMLDSESFFPFIRDASWPSLSDCCVRPLLKSRQDLFIAFGILGTKSTEYLTVLGQQESGVPDAEIYRRALTNLRNRSSKPKWMLHKIGDETFMMRSGDELVSSDILNSKGMRKLNDFFAVQRVAIGMPSHFTMVATANADLLKGIVLGMHAQAKKDDAGPLSRHIFQIEHGILIDEPTDSPTTGTMANISVADEPTATRIALGLSAVTIFVAKAKGSLSDQSGKAFWTEFNRRFGVAHGEFASLIASAEATFHAAMAAPERPGSRIAEIAAMATVLRSTVNPEEFNRLIEAIFKTSMHFGELGTGIFGIGRKFPEEMRPLVWCLAGLLGVEPMTF
jgi:hypothetical protein